MDKWGCSKLKSFCATKETERRDNDRQEKYYNPYLISG